MIYPNVYTVYIYIYTHNYTYIQDIHILSHYIFMYLNKNLMLYPH